MSKTQGKRNARDYYATPQWCIDGLANTLYTILNTGIYINPFYLCDIGAGDGRIGLTCKAKLLSIIDLNCLFVDIVKIKDPLKDCTWLTKDFMKINLNKLFRKKLMPRLFVSNPPFSMSNQIVFKTIDYLKTCRTGIAAFLLRLNWLGSNKRAAWLQENPPGKLLVLTPRPSFTGKGTDSPEYAWFLWSRGIELGSTINIIRRDHLSDKENGND